MKKEEEKMKKIMFNDHFGLTDLVLEGKKTQTRRIIKPQPIYDINVGMVWKEYASGRGGSDFEEPQASYRNFAHHSPIMVGEVVAVAQCYKEANVKFVPPRYSAIHGGAGRKWGNAEKLPSWINKLFVRANLMPHQIKITNVRVERLQDISDKDCIAEGIERRSEQTAGITTPSSTQEESFT